MFRVLTALAFVASIAGAPLYAQAPFLVTLPEGVPETALPQSELSVHLKTINWDGSPDPNGVFPGRNLPWGSGFQCVSRADADGINLSLSFINMVTEPMGQQNLIVFEKPFVPPVVRGVPSLGAWGQWVMAALLGLGGVLMIRRRTQPVHPDC